MTLHEAVQGTMAVKMGGSNTTRYSNRNQPADVTRVCTDMSASLNVRRSEMRDEFVGINDQGPISKLMLSRLEDQGSG
jgi:hypothetical protein